MKYAVEVTWRMAGTFIVEAESEEQAKAIAYNRREGLPEDRQYVDDSLIIDEVNVAEE